MWIYPAIDILQSKCVRLRQGDYQQKTVFSENPVEVAQTWVRQGASRIHLVDLDGAKSGQPINEAVIRDIAATVSVPCQLGGGIRTGADLERVFSWGIRWAVLGTKAIQNPEWLMQMAEKYPDRIVLGLDARDGLVATEGWLSTSTIQATALAKQVENAPLAAVVYTDIAKDGMMAGPNFESLREMRQTTKLRVIASGGVTTLAQAEQLHAEGTYGAIIGRALYEGTISLTEALTLEQSE